MVFNGIEGTVLRKVYLPREEKEQLTRRNLLRVGQNYNAFEMPDYLSRLTKGLSDDLGRNVEIVEKKLSPLEKMKLNKSLNPQIGYSTNYSTNKIIFNKS